MKGTQKWFEEDSIKERMHKTLQRAWPYVNRPFTSNSARNEVGRYALSEVPQDGLDMLFAIQTAWTFVHGSGDEDLQKELLAILRYDKTERN